MKLIITDKEAIKMWLEDDTIDLKEVIKNKNGFWSEWAVETAKKAFEVKDKKNGICI